MLLVLQYTHILAAFATFPPNDCKQQQLQKMQALGGMGGLGFGGLGGMNMGLGMGGFGAGMGGVAGFGGAGFGAGLAGCGSFGATGGFAGMGAAGLANPTAAGATGLDPLAMNNLMGPGAAATSSSAALQQASMLRDSSAVAAQAALSGTDRKRKGRTGTFPQKLHQMLSDLERAGQTDIASFLSHGRAFAIHKPRDFVKQVMPKYFRMSRFSSFQRQLNLYDFQRITEGPDKGAYFHELFVQGRPILSTMMKRNKIKGVKQLQQQEREHLKQEQKRATAAKKKAAAAAAAAKKSEEDEAAASGDEEDEEKDGEEE